MRAEPTGRVTVGTGLGDATVQQLAALAAAAKVSPAVLRPG
jgi:hypothetical protein